MVCERVSAMATVDDNAEDVHDLFWCGRFTFLIFTISSSFLWSKWIDIGCFCPQLRGLY